MNEDPSRDKQVSKDESTKNPTTPPPEPHLLDAESILKIAQWLVEFVGLAAVGGVIGNAAYDYLKNLSRRHGKDRVKELEQETYKLIEEAKQNNDVDEVLLKRKISELFEDFR